MAGKTWQIVLAGTGGQGLIFAGVTLAKAAVLEKKNAVQTQSYGIQSRGGYSQAEIVISENPIYFPKCDKPDLVLALSQAAYDRYAGKVSKECVILYDEDCVKTLNRPGDLGFPFTAKALDLGSDKVINILALGGVIKLCPVAGKESIAQIIAGELAEKALALNLEALAIGFGAIGVRES